MYDENLHNIRIYFTNSHVYVLLYAYNCVIITYNLPGVKDIKEDNVIFCFLICFFIGSFLPKEPAACSFRVDFPSRLKPLPC